MASWRPGEVPGAGVSRGRYHSLDVELRLQQQQQQQMQERQRQEEQLRNPDHQQQPQQQPPYQEPPQQEALQENQNQDQSQPPSEVGGSRGGQPPPVPEAVTAAEAAKAAKAARRLEHQPLLQPASSGGGGASGSGAAVIPAAAAAAGGTGRRVTPAEATATAGPDGGGLSWLRAPPAGPSETPGQIQMFTLGGDSDFTGGRSSAAAWEPWSPSDIERPGQVPRGADQGGSAPPPPPEEEEFPSPPTSPQRITTRFGWRAGRGGGGGGGGGDGGGGGGRSANSRMALIIAIMSVITFLSVVVFFVVAVAVWNRRGRGRPVGPDADPWGTAGSVRELSLRDMHLIRPRFHIRHGGRGWINDPNGLMQYRGIVHVFFQFNPYSDMWGPMHWGHVASPDLVHWVQLPVALRPGDPWDRDGCWSGSALIADDGVPRLFYTGVANFSDVGYYYQTQAVALPADPADPFLTRWIKPPQHNPLGLQLPPGSFRSQFRDPIAPWRVPPQLVAPELMPWRRVGAGAGGSNSSGGGNSSSDSDDAADGGGVWFTAVGTMDDCVGAAALYSSPDLGTWSYAGTLFSQLGQNYTEYKQCLTEIPPTPPGARTYGGPCDQLGPECRMWECPGFFTLNYSEVESSAAQAAAEAARLAAGDGAAGPNSTDAGGGASSDALGGDTGVTVFKYSDQMRNRSGFAADWYQLGSPSQLNYSLVAFVGGKDVFSPRLLLPPLPSPAAADSANATGGNATGGGGGGPPRVLDSEPQRWDFGTVYASQSFRMDDGRLVWLGWVYEDNLGCSEMCGQGTPLSRAVGWQGVLTFPRVVKYDSDLRQLIVRPAQELQLLRAPSALYEGYGSAVPDIENAAAGGGGGDAGGSGDGAAAGGGSQRTCCWPSVGSCRNGTVEEPAGSDSAAAEAAAAAAGGGAQLSCGDSACWMLLPVEVKPEVYGSGAGGAAAGSGGSAAAAAADTAAADTSNLDVSSSHSYVYSQVSAALRRQMEIQLNFTIELLYMAPPPPAAAGNDSSPPPAPPPPPAWLPVEFEVGMRLLLGNGSHVAVYINGTAPPPPPPGAAASAPAAAQPTLLGGGVAAAAGGGLYVERSCAGGQTNGSLLQGGPMPLWTTTGPDADAETGGGGGGGKAGGEAGSGGGGGMARVAVLGASLQVLVDHSVLEAFGGGGRAAVTSRFYPAGEDVAWGVQAYGKFHTQQQQQGDLGDEAQQVLQRARVGFQGAVWRLEDGV
ncbi:hypothetical protein PLESTM_001518300 [Pleodorina starrii]|nr:hypothetical protein PLESTM_001518300 [Pleodorina starrii]